MDQLKSCSQTPEDSSYYEGKNFDFDTYLMTNLMTASNFIYCMVSQVSLSYRRLNNHHIT